MASDYVFDGRTYFGFVDGGGGVQLGREIGRPDSSWDKQIELIEVLVWTGYASAAMAVVAACVWAPTVVLRFPFSRKTGSG